MTKRLLIARHAQAVYADNGDDLDRALTPQGRLDAQAQASRLSQAGLVPAHVLCSPARRTRETLSLLMPGLGEGRIAVNEDLYDASPGTLFEKIKMLDDAHGSALLVGHSPGVHGLAMLLALPVPDEKYRTLYATYAPGTVSVFECPVERWADLAPGENNLLDLLLP